MGHWRVFSFFILRLERNIDNFISMIIYVNLCALCSVRFLNFHFLVLINTSFIPTNFSNLLSVEISKNIKIIYRIDNFWMWHKNQKDPTQNLVDEEIILFSCYYMYLAQNVFCKIMTKLMTLFLYYNIIT